jgi:hypothetical protein
VTELADQFVLGLRARGYTFHLDEEDLVIQSKAVPGTAWHLPRIVLEDEALELLLAAAIASFAEAEGPRWFRLGPVLGSDPDPGMN